MEVINNYKYKIKINGSITTNKFTAAIYHTLPSGSETTKQEEYSLDHMYF